MKWSLLLFCACAGVSCLTTSVPWSPVKSAIPLGLDTILHFNHSAELIGPWITLSRYVVLLLTKQPITPDFFKAIFAGSEHTTAAKLLGLLRLYQPFVYQAFEGIIVSANSFLVTAISIFMFRTIGTCGASKEQDITVNYRLLLNTYIVSAWMVMGIAIFFAVIVLSCDYSIDAGVRALSVFIASYKNTLNDFLDRNMVGVASATEEALTKKLVVHRRLFTSDFGINGASAVGNALRKQRSMPSVFINNYTDAISSLIVQNTPDAVAARDAAAEVDLMSQNIRLAAEDALVQSTLFQRYGLIITVTDLLNEIRGQLFTYDHEIANLKVGVASMGSILLDDKDTLFYIPTLREIISRTMSMILMFVAITIGGMMCGCMLGYTNHPETSSPLERNNLSNIAGNILVITSYVMMVGVTLLIFVTGIFMIVGCIAEIFMCRLQRGRSFGATPQLIDYKLVEAQSPVSGTIFQAARNATRKPRHYIGQNSETRKHQPAQRAVEPRESRLRLLR